jgi:hypothetical protein
MNGVTGTKLEGVIEINELNAKISFWGLVTFHVTRGKQTQVL